MSDPFITVGSQTAKYCNIGAFGVLLFDYAITIELEVNLTWKRRWDIPRIIFLISRYLPFAAAALTTYAAIVIRAGQYCISYNRANNAIHLLSIVASECLLVIRVWALWERNKRILFGLLSLGVIFVCAEIALSSTVTNSQSTLVTASTGECLFEGGTTNAISYGFLVAYEIVLLSLTLVKRHLHLRSAQSPLVRALYHDSLRYIGVILFVSIVNIVVTGIPVRIFVKVFLICR
ncbi:hypothetical protein F5I97DRAFT_1140890 [Phlebopus sp. FC_14]|nr:hypothetical protein F5I97DRAFT_1140890 [Phlebopus sp. FC_14]